jgi:hypothetical protein
MQTCTARSYSRPFTSVSRLRLPLHVRSTVRPPVRPFVVLSSDVATVAPQRHDRRSTRVRSSIVSDGLDAAMGDCSPCNQLLRPPTDCINNRVRIVRKSAADQGEIDDVGAGRQRHATPRRPIRQAFSFDRHRRRNNPRPC